ncbi:unnamed protein product [Mytilus edulis]|uniref:Uncharacterized protein n=1 Tax=Mytilus edulis TaxID=6550 RepID=A0A8S3RYX9_MYTED|nr:unnamed protein product [Mytilus edulis]
MPPPNTNKEQQPCTPHGTPTSIIANSFEDLNFDSLNDEDFLDKPSPTKTRKKEKHHIQNTHRQRTPTRHQNTRKTITPNNNRSLNWERAPAMSLPKYQHQGTFLTNFTGHQNIRQIATPNNNHNQNWEMTPAASLPKYYHQQTHHCNLMSPLSAHRTF